MKDEFLKTYQELEREDIAKYPYIVVHPESESEYYRQKQKFSSWREALAAQKQWNKDYPGHVARKRAAV